MRFRRGLWLAAACLLALAGCKKSESSNGGASGTGTSGSGMAGTTGAAGTSTGTKTAVAMITGFGTAAMVTGTATFTEAGGKTTLVVQLNNCVDGKMYPVHIHEGTSCATAEMQGAHWGMATMPVRGEGIPKVMCVGTSGTAMVTRGTTDADPLLGWTVGGAATTSVVGHAFVAHDPDVPAMPPRIGCGVIMMK